MQGGVLFFLFLFYFCFCIIISSVQSTTPVTQGGWTQLPFNPPGPDPRWNAVLGAFVLPPVSQGNPSSRSIVLAGGQNGTGPQDIFGDLWFYNYGNFLI